MNIEYTRVKRQILVVINLLQHVSLQTCMTQSFVETAEGYLEVLKTRIDVEGTGIRSMSNVAPRYAGQATEQKQPCPLVPGTNCGWDMWCVHHIWDPVVCNHKKAIHAVDELKCFGEVVFAAGCVDESLSCSMMLSTSVNRSWNLDMRSSNYLLCSVFSAGPRASFARLLLVVMASCLFVLSSALTTLSSRSSTNFSRWDILFY